MLVFDRVKQTNNSPISQHREGITLWTEAGLGWAATCLHPLGLEENFGCHLQLDSQVLELFHQKQLLCAAANEADERGETDPKQ